MSTYSKVLKPKRGTETQATTANMILAKGELFFEAPDDGGIGGGLGRVKMGDGVTTYANLPYFIGKIPEGVYVATNIGVVISESKWVLNTTTNVYENQVTIEGITEDSYPNWGLVPSADATIASYEKEIYRNLQLWTYNGYVIFRSDTLPDKSITVVITSDYPVSDDIVALTDIDTRLTTAETNITTLNTNLQGQILFSGTADTVNTEYALSGSVTDYARFVVKCVGTGGATRSLYYKEDIDTVTLANVPTSGSLMEQNLLDYKITSTNKLVLTLKGYPGNKITEVCGYKI